MRYFRLIRTKNLIKRFKKIKQKEKIHYIEKIKEKKVPMETPFENAKFLKICKMKRLFATKQFNNIV